MSDASTPLPADALAAAPELPRATPVVGEEPPPPAAPPANLTLHGETWDARIHVDPPEKNSKGRWKRRLRGNAARLALGKPMVGVAAGHAPRPAPASTPGAAGVEVAAEPAPEAPPPVSRLVWDAESAAGAPGAAPGMLGAPEPLRPREAYLTTAKGIVRAQFALATVGIGKAWDAPEPERKAWTDAWQDFLHEYQWPVLGSALALIVLLVDSIAKRRDDPDTKRVGGVLLDLLLGRIRRPGPALIEAQPAPPRQPIVAPPEPINPADGKVTPTGGHVRDPYGFLGK